MFAILIVAECNVNANKETARGKMFAILIVAECNVNWGF